MSKLVRGVCGFDRWSTVRLNLQAADLFCVKLVVLWNLWSNWAASDVALVVVAVVEAIDEDTSEADSSVVAEDSAVAIVFSFGEAGVAIALVQAADGFADVIEFGVHSVSDFAQANNEADDKDRSDHDKFSRDDETSFVVEQLFQH